MKILNTQIIDGYSLIVNSYDDYRNVYKNSLNDIVDYFITENIIIYYGQHKSIWLDDFNRLFHGVSVYTAEFIIYNDKQILLSQTFNDKIYEDFKQAVKEKFIAAGFKILEGIKDLEPGMNIYTTSGKLGNVGIVTANDGKYITAKFSDIVLKITHRGTIFGNHQYKNARFSDKELNQRFCGSLYSI